MAKFVPFLLTFTKSKASDRPAPIAQLVAQLVVGSSGEREVTSSIPGRDIPKSLKMVLAAPRLALRFTR